jgi:hypothetical protein
MLTLWVLALVMMPGVAMADTDGDGVSEPRDCNDWDSSVYPGAPELCDGVQNDCDGRGIPRAEVDSDGDGFVTCMIDPGGWVGLDMVIGGGDCSDTDAAVHPLADDVCDGLDNDCDGVIDDDCPTDLDGDGFTSEADCDDLDAAIYPGAFDLCGDGLDADCDGLDLVCAPLLDPPVPGLAGVDNLFALDGARPDETLWLAAGSYAYRGLELPGCPGVFIDLATPYVLDRVVVDAAGRGTFESYLPARLSGLELTFYAVDLEGCTVSNPVFVDLD